MKTGRQVFKSVIFDNIDNSIEVISVENSPIPGGNLFTVCNPKWAMAGLSFRDPNGLIWTITYIDYETNQISTLLPSEDAVPIFFNEVLLLQLPVFWSGTRINVNEELSARQADSEAQVGPIVWLKEPIHLKLPPQSGPNIARFQFTWACLDFYNDQSQLNADRHDKIIYPMTQLGKEILDTIDRVVGIERPEACDSFEFSRFATESKDGFEKLIIDLALSGTSYTARVEVDEMHYCEC